MTLNKKQTTRIINNCWNTCCTLRAFSIVLLVLFTLSSAIAYAAECNDGIDNDGDGKIDFYQDGGDSSIKDFPTTSSIREYMWNNGYPEFRDSFNNDPYTRQTFCNLAGYREVVSFQANKYSSCHDNVHFFFDPNNAGTLSHFDIHSERACRHKTKIKGIVCGQRLAACENFKDDDGDGAIDLNDLGCERASDDSEEIHDPGCDSPTDDDERDRKPECSDDQDNDQDGAIDLDDFSCEDEDDDDESNPKSQCQDGQDNDGDDLVDLNDPGCEDEQDDSEDSATTECQDGIDNDQDSATDYPADFSCSSNTDDDETNPKSQCQDGQDNDGDDLVDLNDPGCENNQDNSEDSASTQCQDGIDNDNDGVADNLDPGCYTDPNDPSTYDKTRDDESDAQPIGIPEQLTPKNKKKVYNRKPNLTWKAVTYAVSYDVRANLLGQSGQDNIISQQDITETSYKVTSNLPLGKYRWWVRAKGAAGEIGEWQALEDAFVFTITTQCSDNIDNDNDSLIDAEDPGCWTDPNNPNSYKKTRNNEGKAGVLAAPKLLRPVDGKQIYNTRTPNFKWEAVDGAVKYELWVREIYGQSEAIRRKSIEATNFQPKKDMKFAEFKWWVRAYGEAGERSEWSKPFTFTITAECRDGLDNDGDGLVDGLDPGCTEEEDNDESDGTSQCQDGIDNDGDSQIDFQQDPDCESPQDNNEGSEDKRYVCRLSEDFSNNTITNVELLPFGARGDECTFEVKNEKLYTYCPNDGGYRVALKDSRSHDSAVITLSADIQQDQWNDPNGPGIGLQIKDDFGYQLFAPSTPGRGEEQNAETIVIFNTPTKQVFGTGVEKITAGRSYHYRAEIGGDATTLEIRENGQQLDFVDAGFLEHRGWLLSTRCAEADCQIDNLKAVIISKEPIECAPTPTECSDGLDNDDNGLIDLEDPGCDSLEDEEEDGFDTECRDGLDNDGDGVTDNFDPGCWTDPQDPSTYTPSDDDESDATTECQDGIDNDSDGATDHPADFSCDSPQDNDESDPLAQCQDGQDNDGDGATDYPADFSCSSPQDNDERNPKSQCQDGQDNDNDGDIDLNDPGCDDSQDNSEDSEPVACSDNADNDGDGVIDNFDPGCWSDPKDPSTYNPNDRDESDATTECQDGIDNDNDGATDHPADFSCDSPQDNDESDPLAQCQDGRDNDSDGAIDYPADFSCSSPQDNDERNPQAQCQDGQDNDGDSLVDLDDPGCENNQDNTENSATTECQDGIDNDQDGATDYPADFSCSSKTDDDETNPKSQCQDGQDNDKDGATDLDDPGCDDSQDNSEDSEPIACSDGQDNDGDNLIDAADPGCWTDPKDSSTYNPNDRSENDATTECQDKLDNDGDDLIDSLDPGCWTDTNNPSTYDPALNDESSATTQCQDKTDNDDDGVIDELDPGCWTDPSDPGTYLKERNSENNGTTQCQDGIDNDGDIVVDNFDPGCWTDPKDPSTYTSSDNDESNATTECQDGIDNDADIVIDAADPGCWEDLTDPSSYNPALNDESLETTQCQDGIDNDGDTMVDLDDSGCDSPEDNDEDGLPECMDEIDNDDDGLIDTADPGCEDPTDDSEDSGTSECQDGLDNDNDALVDANDPGCWADINDPSTYVPTDFDESDATTQCQDGIDNDGDGYIDADDVSCDDPTDNREDDPQPVCQDGLDNDGDSLIDAADPGCRVDSSDPNSEYNPNGTSEEDSIDKTCGDGQDNDNDGLVDAQDPDCWTDPSDPDTYDPTNPNGENVPQFEPCSNNLIALRDKADLVGVAIYERSGKVIDVRFGKDSAELGSDIEQSVDFNDFATEENEYYDAMVSNSDGELDINGSYLTIEALSTATGGLTSNIDAVHLVFADGSEVPADIISKVTLGENIAKDVLATSGFAKLALGEKDEASTILGDGQSKITVGFCEALDGFCQPGDPCTCEGEENISANVLQARGDDQYQLIIESVDHIRSEKVFKSNSEVRWDTKRRRRRGWIRILKLHEILFQIPGVILTNCPADVACTNASNADLKTRAEKLVTQLWKIGRNTTRLERRKGLINKTQAQAQYKLAQEYRDVRLDAISKIPDDYLNCQ